MRLEPRFRAVALLFLAACSGAPGPSTTPVPAPAPPVSTPASAPAAPSARIEAPSRPPVATATAMALPPIPIVDGPLNLHVVYPSPNQQLGVRDSNYIFGSTGSGSARLTIDGIDVPVLPNGAFLAWIPVPSGESP